SPAAGPLWPDRRAARACGQLAAPGVGDRGSRSCRLPRRVGSARRAAASADPAGDPGAGAQRTGGFGDRPRATASTSCRRRGGRRAHGGSATGGGLSVAPAHARGQRAAVPGWHRGHCAGCRAGHRCAVGRREPRQPAAALAGDGRRRRSDHYPGRGGLGPRRGGRPVMFTRNRRTSPPTSAAFTPDADEGHPRHLRIGYEWVASFAVAGYPREVHAGWLQPLLTHPARLDVSLHIEPIDPQVAAERLKKQLGRLESGRRHTAAHGRLADPQVEAATEDAQDLSDRLARGEGRLFRVGLYLTVHANSEHELVEEVSALRALTASLLMDAKPTTYRSLQGWVTALPTGLDQIRMTR